MTTTTNGKQAEDIAVEYLKSLKYLILDQNWRTRFCEIDIIAKKEQVVYFVEVKYRATDSWGAGLEYITPSKLKQMTHASQIWVTVNDWSGDYQLAVVEVSGQDFVVTNFLTEL